MRNPVDRLTEGLPLGLRVAIDWIVTIAGAILIVLAIKAFVVNPYRIPSSSMEPTLHCARPGLDCQADWSDRVLANRFIYHFREPERGEIVVFETPELAKVRCGAGGTFVKRLMGVPGDVLSFRAGRLFVNGKPATEPYARIDPGENRTYRVPRGRYFMLGDNRPNSCDSTVWGPVARDALVGPVFAIYWPPRRIDYGVAAALLVAIMLPVRRRRRPSRA